MLKGMLRIFAFLALSQIWPAQAQIDSRYRDEQLAAAGQSIVDGHVKEGFNRLSALQKQINSSTDKETHWVVSTTVVEFLTQIEDYADVTKILDEISSTKIYEANPNYLPWMLFYVGRNLYNLHKADEARKYLSAVTGGDQRLVLIPRQRAAAVILSKLELEKGDINQAAIWMRRAVIGTAVDKGAGSEEIFDLLTEYAFYLVQTRQLSEAYQIFLRLSALYRAYFPRHSPKFLHFMSTFVTALSAEGNFPAVDIVYKELKDDAEGVDIVSQSVQNQLWYQELYQSSRGINVGQKPSISERLTQITENSPGFLSNPDARIDFEYLALIPGDLGLAEHFNSANQNKNLGDARLEAYDAALNSLMAAANGKFDRSIKLVQEAIDKAVLYHRRFETETVARLPAITVEERMVLSLIMASDAPHATGYDQVDTIFKLGQFLNRDKVKLGLNENVARRELKSDLQREDIRSRDRLEDIRDRLMNEATDLLLSRVLPIRNFAPAKQNDFGYLIRLQDIEDKIASANENLHQTMPEFSGSSAGPIELSLIQKLIKPNEVLVMHNVVSEIGIVTTCVESGNLTLSFKPLKRNELQQLNIDEKLLLAAVHNPNEPSTQLDASLPNWPAQSSNRLYRLFFGDIDQCLMGKNHILLATDADFFALPLNALLTDLPSKDFHFREASWLPKKYALSLLPSVRSLYELRAIEASSNAQEKFLGIGNPDFKGNDRAAQITLGPLFSSRGVANRAAIAELPALPESADELTSVANALGAPVADLLLGEQATEHELRRHPLNDYRVISFATHAIVAGDIEGVTEPALVLSPGRDGSSPTNDGLLTASKIANLTLDANLVILSACNTAASDGHASGRGLSGLADAFFFAGARSVAVTQWDVFSSAAEKIGAGLVSRSIASGSGGVSEGLRATMMDYVESAKEDYLANPRFWGAFVIAGDGAVRPLDGVVGNKVVDAGINLEWEHLSPEPADSEILSVTKGARDGSQFILGIERPALNEKRAGSYLGRVDAGGNLSVIDRDHDMAASGVISLGRETGVLTYIPRETKSSAIFRLLDAKGGLLWQHSEDGATWTFPRDIVKAAIGYVLISIEEDYSSPERPSTLVLTSVSDGGETLAQRRYTLAISSSVFSSSAVVIDAKGNLVAAVGGTVLVSPTNPTKQWINKRTGTVKYCSPEEATQVLSVNTQTLDIQSESVIQNVSLVSLKLDGGRIFAAGQTTVNCRLEKQAEFGEIGSTYEFEPIFKSNNVNAIEVRDMEIGSDGIVILAGTTRTFLPTAVSVSIMSLEQLKNVRAADPWAEAFWETSEQRGVAFVLALSKDGVVLGDRVFPDLQNRGIAGLALEPLNRFIAVGSAFGDRGWAAGLRLGDSLERSAAKVPVSASQSPH